MSRKVVYSVAMSLDGFVAGPNGEADWIVMDPEIDFMKLMARFDTILMGRKTFEASQHMGGGGGMPGVTSYVVSKTMRQEEHPKVSILGGDLKAEIAELKAAPGNDIWLFGGGSLFRSMLDLGLVDSVEVAVIPVLLGGGVPLLPPGDKRAKLKLVGSKTYQTTGTVSLEYAVLRSK
jgi:dihydrofolate reductase